MTLDQFTKLVECVPLPSQTAEVTAKAAVDNFLGFGRPFQIFSDQGRNLESNLLPPCITPSRPTNPEPCHIDLLRTVKQKDKKEVANGCY